MRDSYLLSPLEWLMVLDKYLMDATTCRVGTCADTDWESGENMIR